MTTWLNTIALPKLYVHVHAKGDDENEFEAMLVPGDVWCYASEQYFGIAAIVKFWRPNREWDLLAWLYDNHGILVTTTADGLWTCQYCGHQNAFANLIDHKDNCVWKLAMERFI